MSTSRSCHPTKASLSLLLLVECLLWNSSCSWTTAPTGSFRRTVSLEASSSDNDDKPDLFEYFDPLLSPHAYPNGISPDNKPSTTHKAESVNFNSNSNSNVFPVKPAPLEEYFESATASNGSGDNQKEQVHAPDEDALFDPRISPHAYPQGTDHKSKPQPAKDERYNPLKFRMFQENVENQQQDADPNANANTNTPVVPTSSRKSSGKVGILLMDHGSRNEASNQRLEQLAELYKRTMPDDNVVVFAAHMEIVKPSIPDGLQALLDQGVGKCILQYTGKKM
jgi:hypothetical protein